MIEIKDVKKSFADNHVLKGISARFEKGCTSMIIGGSGTGKSVLLKCIVGLLEPDEGCIAYDNRDFYKADTTVKQEIRSQIGMLFQGSALFDSMTVRQNVMFPLDMRSNLSAAEKKDRVETCLERVELSHAMDLMPSEISGGMKKRVGIARAIVMQSQYLFCDEPNSGLDPNTSILIDNLILEITEEFNLTTVIVSHDMNSVMEIGKYVMFMSEGEKIWEGTNDDIIMAEHPKLQEFIFSNKLMKKFKAQQMGGSL